MTDASMDNLVVEATEFIRNRYFGKYRGVVKDIDDPENSGRIIAQVPEVYGERKLPWAMPSVPFAGPDHGLVVLPEVDTGVWIEFEAGDISRPIWSGCWWASDEMPSSSGPQTRVLVTSGGHKFVLDDEENKLQLIHSGGAEFTMTDDEITIKIGSSQIKLSSSGVSINDGALEVR